MAADLKANIWKFALILVTNKRIFVAILGAYYLTVPGVDAAGIGIILLAGNLAGFALEIPSGYISDKLGHKRALVIARALIMGSTVFFLFANNILVLIAAAIVWSAGLAFHSGTGSAFMHETLRGLKREGDYARIMGKISSVGFAVPIVLTTLVPFLVDISFKAPFVIALVLDAVGLVAAMALTTPPVPPEEIKEVRAGNFARVMREGLDRGFFPFALFSGLVGGLTFGVGIFRAPYQVFLEIPVIWYGVFFGAGRVLASLMLAWSGKLKAATTILTFYRFQIALYALLILGLAASSSVWVIVALFIVANAFQWGLSRVDDSYLVEIIKDSRFKATLLSTRTQIFAAVSAVVSFGMGQVIVRTSYPQAFLYLAAVFVLALVPLYIYIVKKSRTATGAPFVYNNQR